MPGEQKEQVVAWKEEIHSEMEELTLPIFPISADGWHFGEKMGWQEGALCFEAEEMWLKHRDTLLAKGMDHDKVGTLLAASFLEWVEAPDERLEGLTPRKAIDIERASLPVEGKDEEYDDDEDDDEDGV